jgi:drug/metabolite transporter (DMT)-like permease
MALASAFCGAMAAMLARKIMKYCGQSPDEYIPIHYSILTAMLIPFLPFFYKLNLTPTTGALLCLLYILDLFGNYFYLKSFALQRVYKISAISATAPIFSLMLYPVLGAALGISLSMAQIAGVLVIVLGLVIINFKRRPREENGDIVSETGLFYNLDLAAHQLKDSMKTRKTLYPVLAAMFMGFSVYLMKYLFNVGATNPYTYYTTRNIVFMVVFLFWLQPNFKEFLGTFENIKWLFIRGIFVIGQWLLLLYAIQLGNPVVSKALGDTIPIFVVVFSYLIWKNRMKPRKILGTVIVVIGVALMTLF